MGEEDHIEIEEEDDDIIELAESIKTKEKDTTKRRWKLTLEVWMHFEMLSVGKDGNKKKMQVQTLQCSLCLQQQQWNR